MTLYEFVNSLIDNIKQGGVIRTYISMPYGEVKVDIFPINGRVYINMDNVDMGYFEEINNRRGTYYIFHQKYRVGIRDRLTANENLIKNICEMHDIIDFHSA